MRRLLLPILLFLAGSAAAAPPGSIRVRLFEREAPDCVVVRAADTSVNFHARSGRPATLSLQPDESATVCSHQGALRIAAAGDTLYARHIDALSQGNVHLSVGSGGATVSRQYPHRITFGPDERTLLVVNTVPLDPYVAGVVAHEYGLDDVEGTEAMTIVARTYALRMRERYADRAYDVTDHTGDQLYWGVGEVSQRLHRAAEATSGLVLTHRGSLVEAVYSSSNGGHGASNEDVWASAPLAYLRGRPDRFDGVERPNEWHQSLDRERVLSALSNAAGRAVTGWTINERSPDGRVKTVTLLHDSHKSTLSGTRFRAAITAQLGAHALRSTLFDARRSGNVYVFEGRGYGHGVGMSQWGAHAMARQGHSAREILAFYYPGTQVERRDATDQRLADLPTAPSERSTPAERTPVRAVPPAPDETRRIGWRR
jgi:stage II sporulation protein D